MALTIRLPLSRVPAPAWRRRGRIPAGQEGPGRSRPAQRLHLRTLCGTGRPGPACSSCSRAAGAAPYPTRRAREVSGGGASCCVCPWPRLALAPWDAWD